MKRSFTNPNTAITPADSLPEGTKAETVCLLAQNECRALTPETGHSRFTEEEMKLDGFGLFVNDMAKMIRFYRDVLGFEIKEDENTSNVYLVKDGTLFLLYGRNDLRK